MIYLILFYKYFFLFIKITVGKLDLKRRTQKLNDKLKFLSLGIAGFLAGCGKPALEITIYKDSCFETEQVDYRYSYRKKTYYSAGLYMLVKNNSDDDIALKGKFGEESKSPFPGVDFTIKENSEVFTFVDSRGIPADVYCTDIANYLDKHTLNFISSEEKCPIVSAASDKECRDNISVKTEEKLPSKYRKKVEKFLE